MEKIVNIEQAAVRAKSFLSNSAGVITMFLVLEGVKKEGDVWVVDHRSQLLMGPELIYTVRVDSSTGEILEYTKRPAKQ